jgi:hypothetical protein
VAVGSKKKPARRLRISEGHHVARSLCVLAPHP